jgi:hypothetical protein
MIIGYNKFIQGSKINENIAGAKKIIKDTYLFNKAVSQVSSLKADKSGLVLLSEGDPIKSSQIPEDIKDKAKDKIKDIKLSPDEVQFVDKNPKLKEIRDLLGGKDGYAQLFTYLHVKELTPIEDLRRIFSGLVEYNDLLSKMRRPINNYIDPSIENNTEQIVDDLEDLSRWRKLKKFVNEFTKVLKDSYKDTPKVYKDKLVDIAAAFDELGKDTSGKIDAEKQRLTQKRFFDKIGRYQSIRDLITSAEEFLKSEANADSSKFYEAIDRVNQKYGTYGANLLYDEGGLLIVEVKSFQACKDLYSNTSWCIASYQNHWDAYVGGDAKFTRQYCVTNFNLSPADNKSIIGITVGPNKKVEACHLKNDAGASTTFMGIFAEFEKSLGLQKGFIWDGMKPMADEDIEKKRKRIEANRNVTKAGLTLDQIRKYIVDEGADPNYQQGKALENAVIEADPANPDKYKEAVEKIKFLLDHGASPNLKAEGDAVVNKVKTFEVLKLLISKQAALTKIAFKTLANDYAAVEFCLENGLDPDFENNMPMRLAIKEGRLDIIKLLEKNGVSEENKRCNITKHAAEYMFFDVLDYFIQKKGNYVKELDQVMHWVAHSVRRTRDEKVKILGVLQKYIDDGIGEFNKEGYVIGRDKNRKKVDIEYVLEHYKSLKDFYVSKIDEKR